MSWPAGRSTRTGPRSPPRSPPSVIRSGCCCCTRSCTATRTAADLSGLDGVGTTGQVYHHLRLLTGAGWLRATARGHYAVPPHRVLPLLAVLAAAR